MGTELLHTRPLHLATTHSSNTFLVLFPILVAASTILHSCTDKPVLERSLDRLAQSACMTEACA